MSSLIGSLIGSTEFTRVNSIHSTPIINHNISICLRGPSGSEDAMEE
jgi:NhaP-type Na+/H+ and K+/H+ antiporter